MAARSFFSRGFLSKAKEGILVVYRDEAVSIILLLTETLLSGSLGNSQI